MPKDPPESDRMSEEMLSKLLRLKRYEQPPAEYFESFLSEFHYRQRAALLRRPAWRTALGDAREGAASLFGRWMPATVSQFAYATASIAVLAAAGVVTVNMLAHPGNGVRGSFMAHQATTTAASALAVSSQPSGIAMQPVSHDFTLDPQIRLPEAPRQSASRGYGASSQHPRYVLDMRPVSYEPQSNF